ncbi:MAG: aminotransferase class I/II-fold pyridoxal phosphate-dependent enzyme [Anaerovibrio sp.]|uniref:MalY/PatB family protein n=1 Tax=Anaerovibrio sp. TaxID=1872532 RepID=UPI0025D6C501|nr:aminotransferase class I/II-fold pyridoxal phosphate-dependent enzyme [Anaerovibrio sp.]MCR5175618.1 aminotransferase class I/II-fold pyridoxal phosphate-dependent enzyme [Anaerovibrio sp.]
MKFNFDEIVDRTNTNALNTDGFRGYIFHAGPEKKFPYKDDEFVRMWVADMEFATPQPIIDAVKNRLDRRIFGYTMMFNDDYYNSFSAWCRKMYDWGFPKEELAFSTGVIPALYQLLELLVAKDEKLIINTPAYGYFKHAAEYNKVQFLDAPLFKENNDFKIDFDNLEKMAADPQVKLLLWCNPHNPSGRVWSEAELKQVADIVRKNDLWIISDEIHCDILRSGIKHIPMGKVMPDYKKLITCMSASKTFNMAGLMFSNIIIRDERLRGDFNARDKNAGMLNPLSIAAHKAAYDSCGEWLGELKQYLDGNFDYVKKFLDEKLPEAVFKIPEATYLAWVDMGKCLPGIDNMSEFFAYKAGVLLEGGDDLFVGNARGYIRLNLAMPQSVLKKGMDRMYDAIQSYRNA